MVGLTVILFQSDCFDFDFGVSFAVSPFFFVYFLEIIMHRHKHKHHHSHKRRYKLAKRFSKRLFSHTAARFNKRNASGPVMRGGIRF